MPGKRFCAGLGGAACLRPRRCSVKRDRADGGAADRRDRRPAWRRSCSPVAGRRVLPRASISARSALAPWPRLRERRRPGSLSRRFAKPAAAASSSAGFGRRCWRAAGRASDRSRSVSSASLGDRDAARDRRQARCSGASGKALLGQASTCSSLRLAGGVGGRGVVHHPKPGETPASSGKRAAASRRRRGWSGSSARPASPARGRTGRARLRCSACGDRARSARRSPCRASSSSAIAQRPSCSASRLRISAAAALV